MDYGRLLSQTFFSHFYNSITNPTRKSTLTLNTRRCFFTKLAGGELLKQSVCVLMFPLRMLFCSRSLGCNSVRDYLLSVFFLHKKRGVNLHLKWHIVGLGTERGQMNTRGFLEYREKQGLPFIYLFWLFDLFRLISTGSNEPVGLIVDLFFLVVLKPSAKISLGSFFCVSLWPACVDTAWYSRFLTETNNKMYFGDLATFPRAWLGAQTLVNILQLICPRPMFTVRVTSIS